MRWNIIFVTAAKQAEKPKPARPRFDFKRIRRAGAVALGLVGLLVGLGLYLFTDNPEGALRMVVWGGMLGVLLWAD